ncbi:UNVERIFIED_CONTAM: hypothetical protein Sradi_4849400 [Sesamum radiatum]|uniref:Uncharacterized protein n=1 Tax=Sesamum radiatum TaxID=300843 RepID=A0AAW2MXZ3_SESRA
MALEYGRMRIDGGGARCGGRGWVRADGAGRTNDAGMRRTAPRCGRTPLCGWADGAGGGRQAVPKGRENVDNVK